MCASVCVRSFSTHHSAKLPMKRARLDRSPLGSEPEVHDNSGSECFCSSSYIFKLPVWNHLFSLAVDMYILFVSKRPYHGIVLFCHLLY